MKTAKTIFVAALLLTLGSCTKPKVYFGDLDGEITDIEGLDQSLFTITSTKSTVIDGDYISRFESLMAAEGGQQDQEDTQEGQTKATSTTAIGFLQKVLQSAMGTKVTEIAGTYTSFDHNYERITLSGKIIVPSNARADRYIVVSHYTIASNDEAPSLAFPLEGMLARLGYILVIPDYEGYGVTVDHQHPYLVMPQTAENVTDMFLAVRKLFENTKIRPIHDDIYLYGYSQGGATTLATLMNMEFSHPDIQIRGVFAGGGPYDIRATYMSYIDTNYCGYPFALPIVLQGMIVGNNLDINIRDLLQPRIADKYSEWYESKKYTTGQVNSFIGTHVASEILNEKGMNPRSPEIAELFKAMTENSIVFYQWTPKAPIYLFHSIDDDTVPYVNAVKLKDRWTDANVQCNFGHYGNHILGCVRFLLTVNQMLDKQID